MVSLGWKVVLTMNGQFKTLRMDVQWRSCCHQDNRSLDRHHLLDYWPAWNMSWDVLGCLRMTGWLHFGTCKQTGSRYLRTGGLSRCTVRLATLSLVLGQAHGCLQVFDHLLALLLEWKVGDSLHRQTSTDLCRLKRTWRNSPSNYQTVCVS